MEITATANCYRKPNMYTSALQLHKMVLNYNKIAQLHYSFFAIDGASTAIHKVIWEFSAAIAY